MNPIPLDNREIRQAIVQYIGLGKGAFTISGPSGREYGFAMGENSLKYVAYEELDKFRRLADFCVCEDTLNAK